MSRTTKALLILEVTVCFLPLALILLMGIIVAPFSLLGGPVGVVPIAWVAGGIVGLVALWSVIRWLLENRADLLAPRLVRIFLCFGVLAMLPFAVVGELVGILPLISTVHLCYLARGYVFALPNRGGGDVPAA